MAHRKRCLKCKQNKPEGQFEPADNDFCINCDKKKGRGAPRNPIARRGVHPAVMASAGAVAHQSTNGQAVAFPNTSATIPKAVKTREKPCPGCSSRMGRLIVKQWHQFFRDDNAESGLSELCKDCTIEDSMPNVQKANPPEGEPIEEVKELRCRRCSRLAGHDILKPITEFNLDRNSARGRQPDCRPCQAEYQTEWKQRQAEKLAGAATSLGEKPDDTQPREENVTVQEREVALVVPNAAPNTAAIRMESRQVTLVPAFVRLGGRSYNLANIAYTEPLPDGQASVVLNIHDFTDKGIQYPRSFVLEAADAIALSMALDPMMVMNEYVHQIATMMASLEEARRNETAALGLATEYERQVDMLKERLGVKNGEMARLKELLSLETTARLESDARAAQSQATLDEMNRLLGRVKS